jgi:hypothetical protein
MTAPCASQALRRVLAGTGLTVIGLVACGVLSWLVFKLIPDAARVRFPLAGDYGFDADAPLLRGIEQGPFALFSGHPAPLMLSLSLLLRLPALLIGHSLDLLNLNHPQTSIQRVTWVAARMEFSSIWLLAIGSFAGVWATWRSFGAWRPRLAGILLVIAVLFAPLSIEAVEWGHVEDTFGTLLLIAALISVGGKRWLAAVVFAACCAAVKQQFLFIIPTIFLLLPADRRLRLAGVGSALWVLLVIPVMAPAVGSILHTTASVATAADTSYYDINLWTALGIEQLGSVGKPLAALLALLLPVIVAWRSKWRLSLIQGTAILAIIMFWRCLLDSFDIPYYLATGSALLIVLDWAYWQAFKHPLWRRREPVKRDCVYIPAVGFLAAVVVAATMGGFVADGWAAVFGDVHGKDFLVGMLIVTALLVPAALGVQIKLTRARKQLYGTLAAVTLILIIAAPLFGGRSGAETPLPAPPGYEALTVAELARAAAPRPVYWAGDRLTARYYRRLTVRKVKKNSRVATLIDYGTLDGSGSVTVVTRRPSSKEDKLIIEYLQHCPPPHCFRRGYKHASTVVRTQIGTGLLTPIGHGQWEALIKTRSATVYINSTLAISPGYVLPRLSVVDTLAIRRA